MALPLICYRHPGHFLRRVRPDLQQYCGGIGFMRGVAALIPLPLVFAGGMPELWPSFVLPGLNGVLLIAVLVLLWLWERNGE